MLPPRPDDPVSPTALKLELPSGRPTELDGTGVLNVRALVAAAFRVVVPAHRLMDDPMWALLPLVEGARAPQAQIPLGTSVSPDGAPVRTYRVTVYIDDALPWQIADYAVQEIDDGFRQRRWLVTHYATHWNASVAWMDNSDPNTAGEVIAHCRDLLSDLLRLSAADDPSADPVDTDAKLVAALAAVKSAESWLAAGAVESIDSKMLHEAAKTDILENRSYGILEALSYDAASPGSDSAEWRRVARSDGYRAANFTTGAFFQWAADVSGYNERFVRNALAESEPIRRILDGEQSTKGRKGSVFPEVLDALRDRGRASLEANPVRTLWAQATAGTTVDERVPAGQTHIPFSRNHSKPLKKKK